MNFVIKVYYQDFKLNAMIFNENGLVLNETKSKLVAIFSLETLRAKLKQHSIMLPEHASMCDMADSIFAAFNHHPTEFVTEPIVCFTDIGHTSMSVGDYVTFVAEDFPDQEDVLVCAKAGWKSIGKCMREWKTETAFVLNHIANMPIDIVNALHTIMFAFGRDAAIDLLRCFQDTRCESECPNCHEKENIHWSPKDIQDSIVYQNATCGKCDCQFTEEYKYVRTVIDDKAEPDEEGD